MGCRTPPPVGKAHVRAVEGIPLPSRAGGLLTSGGAMADFVGLKAGRDAGASWDVRRLGVGGRPQLTLYASQEVHVTTDRAADMLGLGSEAVRKIPVDRDYRLRL